MMKRIRSVIISLILLVYLIIVLTFVAIKLGEVTCSGLQAAVNDTLVNSFVNQEEIMRVIKRDYGNIEGMPLLSVNILLKIFAGFRLMLNLPASTLQKDNNR